MSDHWARLMDTHGRFCSPLLQLGPETTRFYPERAGAYHVAIFADPDAKKLVVITEPQHAEAFSCITVRPQPMFRT